MKKLTYAFSGFSVDNHFGKEVNEFFKKDLKKCTSIVFIPGGMEKNNKTDRYVNTDVEWFKEIGINIKKINILDLNIKQENAKNILNNSDIIFLMGGDTLKQYEFIKKINISDDIKNHTGAVIGVSAGAINLGKISICSKDINDGIEKTNIYEGIGRINYTFEPHFDINNQELIKKELLPVSTKIKIYGITNDTAIRINDDQMEIIKGDLYEIYNNKVTIF